MPQDSVKRFLEIFLWLVCHHAALPVQSVTVSESFKMPNPLCDLACYSAAIFDRRINRLCLQSQVIRELLDKLQFCLKIKESAARPNIVIADAEP
jgi:hypothetical protein